MNIYLQKIKAFIWPGKRKYIFLVLVLGVAWWAWSALSGGGDEQNATLFEVKNIELVQEVTVTGSVAPAENVALSFDASGRVASVSVAVGTRVWPGTFIASLSNGNLRADLAKAEAALLEAKKGARPEDIAVSEADLAKAKQDLENYYDSVGDALEEALLQAGDALTTQTDVLFTNGNTDAPLLSFTVSNFQNKVDSERTRAEARRALENLTTLTNTLSSSHTQQKEALESARTHLNTINNYLGVVYNTVNNATGLTSTTQATYKANVTTARTSVTGALSSVNSLLQSIASQEVTVVRSENALALKKVGATGEELIRKEADVTSARALLAKTIISSPIAGVISRADPKVGETVVAGTTLFEVISDGKYEVEVNVPEVDVSKIVIGNNARITLDAYGDEEEFPARVSKINPAENVIDGVPTYKATLVFEKPDERIRSGMTANITIETARKNDVLAIPGRAIITKDGKKFVRVRTQDNKESEVSVVTGIRGSAGLVEIVSGLNVGDRVITTTEI